MASSGSSSTGVPLPPQYSVPSRPAGPRPSPSSPSWTGANGAPRASSTPPPVPPKTGGILYTSPSPASPSRSPGAYPVSPGSYPTSTHDPFTTGPPLRRPPSPRIAARRSEPPPNLSAAVALPPERPPSSSSDQSAASATAGPSSIRLPVTPRKRYIASRARMSPARPLSSPRTPRRRKDSRPERETQPRPPLATTLDYLLTPLRLVLAPLHLLLTPVLQHLVNVAILSFLVCVAFYLVQAWIRQSIGALLMSPTASIPATVAMLPFRTIAMPTCFLANIGCSLSLLGSPNETARPFWHMVSDGGEVDVATVSRELSREARHAKDIFESLTALGDGRMTAGLSHVRIHELGIAIQTGSTLEDRFFIGAELIELADLASDITDEVVMINAMSVNVFSWLFWEFSNLVQLLALPPAQRPMSHRLGARLDSLINRLDLELDRLYLSVDGAIPLAAKGRDQGWSLLRQLSAVHSDLQAEHDRAPGWRHALDVSRRFFAGGDPSKLMRISRDLELTRATINGIDETSKSLERVRIDLTAFRTQVRSFKGSVMGLHLGASEEIGLGPEQEMQILVGIVDELGSAVGRAKRRPIEPERGIEA